MRGAPCRSQSDDIRLGEIAMTGGSFDDFLREIPMFANFDPHALQQVQIPGASVSGSTRVQRCSAKAILPTGLTL